MDPRADTDRHTVREKGRKSTRQQYKQRDQGGVAVQARVQFTEESVHTRKGERPQNQENNPRGYGTDRQKASDPKIGSKQGVSNVRRTLERDGNST